MLEGQNGLHQPSHSGGCIQMTQVTLHRSHGNACGLQASLAVDLIQRRNLNWVSHGRRAAVGLDIADALTFRFRCGQGQGNDFRLAFHCGRGEPSFPASIVVDGRTFDDGIYRIPGGHRILQTLQQNNSNPITTDRAAGLGIEAAAVTIYRSNPSGFVHVAAKLRHADGSSSGNGHIALIGHYRAGSRMHRSQ